MKKTMTKIKQVDIAHPIMLGLKIAIGIFILFPVFLIAIFFGLMILGLTL